MNQRKGPREGKGLLVSFLVLAAVGGIVAIVVQALDQAGATSVANQPAQTARSSNSPSDGATADSGDALASSARKPATPGQKAAIQAPATEQPPAPGITKPSPKTSESATAGPPPGSAKGNSNPQQAAPAAQNPTAPPAPQAVPEKEIAALDAATALSHALRSAAEVVLPSVVTIQHTIPAVQVSGVPQLGGDNEDSPWQGIPDPLLRRFFGKIPQARREPERSLGSGVIIDSSGIVLTNNHVVEGGGKITVKLHDGRKFEATEVKTDPETDLAVIKISGAKGLTAARLGNSDDLEIGDWVIAVGNPFGLTETVTAGIISAKGRGLGITDREEFLQTDAAINPGNSGGPLVDLHGQVVGIDTAISSTNGGYQGIGFAIPVNLAKWVSGQLIQQGKVHRSYLGVGIQELTPELASRFGLEDAKGVVVTQVYPDSPGGAAGLEPGDVILRFDDRAVTRPRELQSLVEEAPAGSTHTIAVLHNKQKSTLTVKVGEPPADFGHVAEREVPSEPSQGTGLPDVGIHVGPLTKTAAERLGLKNVQGVLITSVDAGSLADEAGLAPSMVISRVGQTPVSSVAQFVEAMKQQSLDKGVLLLVRTREGSAFTVLRRE